MGAGLAAKAFAWLTEGKKAAGFTGSILGTIMQAKGINIFPQDIGAVAPVKVTGALNVADNVNTADAYIAGTGRVTAKGTGGVVVRADISDNPEFKATAGIASETIEPSEPCTPGTQCGSTDRAIATASGLWSTRSHRRPSRAAAAPVVPEPA